jgi:hypothetical protein
MRLILEDLLLACRLPVFTRKAKRKTASHPKFYFFDNGLTSFGDDYPEAVLHASYRRTVVPSYRL